MSRESQAVGRSRRQEDRNSNKERTESLTGDAEPEGKKYAYVGMPSDTLSAIKRITSRTVPDCFAPPVLAARVQM